MAEAGKKWVFGIGLYLVVKSVLNLILGFSGANIVMLILAVAALVLMLITLLVNIAGSLLMSYAQRGHK